ncbi:hypothetical protein OVA06_09780 [Pseudarthrobacter sp. SL88]|uniref:hypothetical protein n=1 Tax=Pseudarthrobacter sp. SL88 TaxID=2994666 RepID=UPI002276B8C8|nr:hypothetical protein [Pseudarthrobacter sp. SL88]MCY1674995.1 hypothetical protein [Pseudarthrobacter sp. SL88]
MTLDPEGRLVVTEVKATGANKHRAPNTTQNVADHQLDPQWTSKNLNQTGHVSVGPVAVGPETDQVSRQLAQFDAVSGTLSFWDISPDGRRDGGDPAEVWDVHEIEDLG